MAALICNFIVPEHRMPLNAFKRFSAACNVKLLQSGLPTAPIATALISRSPYFMELSYFYLVKTKILFFYNKKVYMACNLYVF